MRSPTTSVFSFYEMRGGSVSISLCSNLLKYIIWCERACGSPSLSGKVSSNCTHALKAHILKLWPNRQWIYPCNYFILCFQLHHYHSIGWFIKKEKKTVIGSRNIWIPFEKFGYFAQQGLLVDVKVSNHPFKLSYVSWWIPKTSLHHNNKKNRLEAFKMAIRFRFSVPMVNVTLVEAKLLIIWSLKRWAPLNEKMWLIENNRLCFSLITIFSTLQQLSRSWVD